MIGSYIGTNTKWTTEYNVLLGYHADIPDNAATSKSLFVVNNQARISNPLLYGHFAGNANHHDVASAITAPAQLGINTTRLSAQAALTVNGLTYIGNLEGKNPVVLKNDLTGKFNLWVEKGIVSEDFAISASSNWPDYVFESRYQLSSLAQVESFIKQHGHLPQIPSAATVAKDGYSMDQLNKQFMVKIEELTLYAIEQDKEINALKEKLSDYQDLAEQVRALQQLVKGAKQ